MDSHEEKLQKIIMESKMNEARDEMKRKAESIDKAKAEQKKLTQAMGRGSSSSNYGGGYGNNDGYEIETIKKSRQPTVEVEEDEEEAPVKKPVGK
jgi:hypothetical protein